MRNGKLWKVAFCVISWDFASEAVFRGSVMHSRRIILEKRSGCSDVEPDIESHFFSVTVAVTESLLLLQHILDYSVVFN